MSTAMRLFSLGLQCLSLFAITTSIWLIICARKTAEQRIAVLECLRHRAITWGPLMRALEGVSFERHLRALMFRRDPWALYDPIVLDAIRNPRTEVLGMMTGEPPDGPPAIH